MRAPLAAVLFLTACSAPPREVPDPDTTGMESRVRQRIAEAREAVLEDPRSAAAWGSFGMVFDAHELDEEAIAGYRQALELDPADPRWPYFLGRLLAFKGTDFETAADLFRRVVETRPDYVPAHLRLADALAEAGELAAAEASYRRALELDPGFARAHLGLGQVRLRQGDPASAIAPLTRAHELLPEDGTALAALGQAYLRSGDRERAEDAARRARGLARIEAFTDPLLEEVSALGASSTLLVERALEALRTGRFRAAARDLKRVEEARPRDPLVQRDLGRAYQGLGRGDIAISHFEKALAVKDDLVDARAQLGMLLLEAQRIDGALVHLRRARDEAAEDPGIAAGLATALARGGQLEPALEAFAAAAALGPLDAAAHNEWGSALAQAGRYTEAAEHFRTALAQNPESAQVLVNLGLASEALGRPGEAAEYYRRSMEIEPNPLAAGRLEQLGRR